jgi:predicted metal-dependent RNase
VSCALGAIYFPDCLGQTKEAKYGLMSETAKTLRDRIALRRKPLSETADAGVARNYLNEIVMAEAQLRDLESHEKKRPRSDR